jgi:transcriptional regulator with XRE-family HTH domain
MADLPPFAARLRQLRAEAKMTQFELAGRSGLNRQSIAKLELGERQPSWETVQLLARALGVGVAAFDEDQAEAPAKKTRKRKEK